MPKKNVLFICGSLRTRSLNRQVGEYVQSLLPESVKVSWLDYADLPYMNQDTEFPVPPAVNKVRATVSASDALWIFSPEYNYGIPGVLKNCLDWLSRPVEQGSKETAMQGKLTLYCCAGGGATGRFCAADLAETLAIIQTDLVETIHVQVALNRQDYTTDKLELTSSEKRALAAQVHVLLEKLSL